VRSSSLAVAIPGVAGGTQQYKASPVTNVLRGSVMQLDEGISAIVSTPLLPYH
jgi:hypothetical protein